MACLVKDSASLGWGVGHRASAFDGRRVSDAPQFPGGRLDACLIDRSHIEYTLIMFSFRVFDSIYDFLWQSPIASCATVGRQSSLYASDKSCC